MGLDKQLKKFLMNTIIIEQFKRLTVKFLSNFQNC